MNASMWFMRISFDSLCPMSPLSYLSLSSMTFVGIAKSVWPKVFAGIGLVAKFIAMQYYSNTTYFVYGLTAFAFWNMIGDAAVLVGVFVSRQDNMPSEIAGAGNVPPELPKVNEYPKMPSVESPKPDTDLEKLMLEFADFQKKKLEAK